MKRIIITIGDDGEARIEAEGFEGKGCQEATAPFEEALGLDRSKRVLKREYNVQPQRQAVRQGR